MKPGIRTFVAATRRARRRAGIAFVLAAAAAVAAGCGTPPTRYYTLAGDALVADARANAGVPGRRLYVEVGPVGVPERLARPQMVVRSGTDPASTRVDVLEQQRWSASFDRELRDAFAVAIATRLGAIDVTQGGLPPGQPVYQVSIQLRRFDATPAAAVDAVYGWTIRRSDDDRNALCQASISETVGESIDAVVNGVQRTVAQAAARIAAGIAQLERSGRADCPAGTGAAAATGADGRRSPGGRL